jgi:VWFA-related protein
VNGLTAPYRTCALLLCLSFLSLRGVAQQGVPAPDPGGMPVPTAAPPPVSKDRQLMLDVMVTDKSGTPVSGLQQADFTVLDDKIPQKITSFRPVGGGETAAQAEILLVVDEVNTAYNRVTYEREGIHKFLSRNGGKLTYPVSLAYFSDTGTEIMNGSSKDGEKLLASFDQHQTPQRSVSRSSAAYGALERMQLSLDTLNSLAQKEAAKPGRKLIVWIGPGWPILSGPNVDLDRKEEDKLFAAIVSLSDTLRRGRITLYCIDPLGLANTTGYYESYYRSFLKPVSEAKNAQPGNLALQVLAVQSGGLVLNASNDVASEIDLCAADANAFYTLTVDAAPADRPHQYRAVDVKVQGSGLTVRTRGGYYSHP